MVTSQPPRTLRLPKHAWLVLPAMVALIGALLLVLPQATTSNQPQFKVVMCINDDLATCQIIQDVFNPVTGQLAIVQIRPACTDAVVIEAMATDFVLVDGHMVGSQYQGVECVEQLVAARGANPRPLIAGFSTDSQLRTQMRLRAGADYELVPSQVINARNIIAQALGIPIP